MELWLALLSAKSHDPKAGAFRAGSKRDVVMQQQISVITLGVSDLSRSRRFYGEGFGWSPVFENGDIVFYQMNGFVLGLWGTAQLEGDMQRRGLVRPGAFALAHNVPNREAVQPALEHLCRFGGRLLAAASEPPHGGMRGYVADPDDHAWEIAWNPHWPISPEGYVTAAF
jgi:hypothetical protein